MTYRERVKVDLERRALERGVRIVGLHSCRVADDVVDVIYDIEPDETGDGLHFQFPLPRKDDLISRAELSKFATWLAAMGYNSENDTLH